MKKLTNNQWIVGIVTGVIASGVFSVIVYIREKVNFLEAIAIVLTTICTFIKGVITFPVPLWLIVLVGVLIKIFSMKLRKQNENELTTTDFRKYIKDTWKKWIFIWEYERGRDGKFCIDKDSFRPICECGCELRRKSTRDTCSRSFYYS